MTKLILTRHGQSVWNAENRFTGWVDVEFYIRLFNSYNSKKIILGKKYFDLIIDFQ